MNLKKKVESMGYKIKKSTNNKTFVFDIAKREEE